MSRQSALDIARVAGALALEAANAAHEGELFGLLRAGLSGDVTRRFRAPSQSQVRVLVEAHRGPRWDAPETLFTSRIPFQGGDHLVLTGGYDGLDTALEQILTSLFLHPEAPPDELAREAFELAAAVLRLSDHVLRAAGLGRYERSGGSESVTVPATADLRRNLAAVSLSVRDLDKITRGYGAALEPLIGELTTVAPVDGGIGPFGTRPILRDGDGLVLAAPSCLLLALRHHLVLVAKRYGWDGILAQRVRSQGTGLVEGALDRMGWVKTPLRPAADSPLPVTWQVWAVDDGAALVTIVGDDLTDYSEDDPEAPWMGFYRHGDALSEQRDVLAEPLFYGDADELPQNLLHLVVLVGVGRPHVWMSESAHPPLEMPEVAFAVADLETISVAERADPLVLWKFVRAEERLEARMLPGTLLEPLALWRAHDHSFYLGDDERPTALLSSGEARRLREEVVLQRDVHGVPGPQGRGLIDARRRFSNMPVPIYQPVAADAEIPGYYVETATLRCWILAGTLTEATISRLDGLLDTVAYWVWQAAPEISPVLAKRLTASRFEIFIELADPAAWDDPASAPEAPLATVARRGDGQLELRLRPSLLRHFARGDNAGERELLQILLAAFDAALPLDERIGWTESDAAAVVATVAPLGHKKMYLVWNPPPERAIDARNLPDARPPLQEADDAEALDQLGEHLRRALGLCVGPIADEQRGSVLWEAVTFHLAQLLGLLATLSPDGLLEQFVALHERFLERGAWNRYTLATRQACFGEVIDLKAARAEDLPKAATTGSALRFVIECIAAHPPSGIRPLSLEVQDRMVALAAQVMGRGSIADAVREGLEDTSLSILRSGRLGVGRDGRYLSGRDRYLDQFLSSEMRRAGTSFVEIWQEQPPQAEGPDSTDIDALEQAAVEEWGAPLSEILDLFGLLDEMADGEPAVAFGLADAVARITSELDWSEDTANRVIEEFALRPRSEVFNPPAPFTGADTYPWRFGRRLSFIRRPLVIRPGPAGDELVYGFRTVDSTGHWLVAELAGGRLKVSSRGMQRAMTAVAQQFDEAFNDDVGRMYEAVPGMIVRLRVTDVGPLKIVRENGDDLGDIDVLAADPAAQLLHVVDTKHLSVARTPIEIVRELRRTFKSEAGKVAAIDRHVARAAWLEEHLGETLAWLRVDDDPAAWKVAPSIVVDTAVPSAFMEEMPMPVVDVATLGEMLAIR